MSEEAEEVKRLLSFKKRIEKRIEKLESELKELHSILESVNSVLLAKGFKRAELIKKPTAETTSLIEEAVQPISVPTLKPETAPTPEFKEVIPLKTSSGELLANLYVRDNFLRVVLAEDKNFNVNTPPFNQFLVERVLAKMQQKDSELVKAGKLKPEQIFTYNILRDGDFVREIHIKNFDAERLRELKSSIKWTLEKMYEKMARS
jgi:cell division septum initiation protein DivIVA